jgi:hypothetical protein
MSLSGTVHFLSLFCLYSQKPLSIHTYIFIVFFKTLEKNNYQINKKTIENIKEIIGKNSFPRETAHQNTLQ